MSRLVPYFRDGADGGIELVVPDGQHGAQVHEIGPKQLLTMAAFLLRALAQGCEDGEATLGP